MSYNDFSLYISLLSDGIMIVIFFHVEIVVNNAKVFMFFFDRVDANAVSAGRYYRNVIRCVP